MNIDELIQAERAKQRKLQQSLDRTVYHQQFRKRGFFTVTIEHKGNMPKHGIAVVLHGEPEVNPHIAFHNHDYYELIYVYRGECTNTFCSGVQTVLKEGNILLLNPDILHHIYTTTEWDCVFNILISRTLFEETMLSYLSENHFLTNFITNFVYHLKVGHDYLLFSTPRFGPVDEIITNLLYEYLMPQGYEFSNLIPHYFVILLTLLSREYATGQQMDTEGIISDFPLLNMIHYIYQNSSSVSLSVLSELFSYSPAYISRMIKRHCGYSFSHVVQDAKLQQAHKQIQFSKKPIARIAEEAGFLDASYFSGLFQKKYGMTPQNYRRFCNGQK